MEGAGEPVVLRLARALAGRGGEAEPAAPLLVWTGAGSRALVALRLVGARLMTLARPLTGPADSVANALSRRPLLTLAAILVILPGVRLIGESGAPVAAALVAAAGLVVALALARSLHEDAERMLVSRALLVGLLLRAALGLAVDLRGGFPDEIWTYHPLAADAAASWSLGGTSLLPGHEMVANRAAYFYLLGGTYLVAGPWMLVGRALGIAVGLLVAVLAGEVARPLGGRRAAALAVVLLAIHPEHALWSATLSRDSLSTLAVLLALALMLRRPGRLLRGNLLLVAVPVLLLLQNSFLIAGILGATVIVAAVGEAVAARRGVRGLVLAGAALGLLVVALVAFGNRFGPYVTPERLESIRSLGKGLHADLLPGFPLDSWLQVVLLAPLGALMVVFAPFPWTAVHAHRAVYGVLAIPGLAITLLGVAGLLVAIRRRAGAAAPLVVFAILMFLALGVLEGNSGILVRHRLSLTAVLTAVAGALLAGLRRASTGGAP